MGKISKIYYDELIDPVADRNSNRVRVYRAPNNEVTIHFRNLKIVLHTEDEIREWKNGFAEALRKFEEGNYFQNDV